MSNTELNYLGMLEALKVLVAKAEGKEKTELREIQKEFIKKVRKIISIEIEKDNLLYAAAIENLEKTNEDIQIAIKDVNKISTVLNSLTSSMNAIGKIIS